MFGSLNLKKKGKRKKKLLTSAAASFGTAGEDEEIEQVKKKSVGEVRAEVSARMAAQGARAQREAQLEYEKIVAADPTAFKFDEVYDDIHKQKEKAKGETVGEKKSKYIDALLASSRRREFEYEKAKEKLVQQEQLEEEKQFGKATEVFVTGAYKKRLEERRLWEIEEKERAEREAKNDVKKKGNLSGFYTGMIGVLANAPVAVDFDEKLGKKEGKSHKRQLQSANETVTKKKESKPSPTTTAATRTESSEQVKEAKGQTLSDETIASNSGAKKRKVTASAIEAARKRAMERRKARSQQNPS